MFPQAGLFLCRRSTADAKQTPAFNVRQMGSYDKADPVGPQQASSGPPFASSTTRFGGFLFGDDFINMIQNTSQRRRNGGWPMSRVFHATVFPRHAYFASPYACRGPSGWGSPLYRVTGGPQRSSCRGPSRRSSAANGELLNISEKDRPKRLSRSRSSLLLDGGECTGGALTT